VFGFKGTASGSCGLSSLALVWAVEDCNPPKVEAVPKPVEAPVSAGAAAVLFVLCTMQ
jgi:hypothetical protein